jgi:CDP-diacylglycerol--glycerol-3-phosphate 3-phosphatidyltransferase
MVDLVCSFILIGFEATVVVVLASAMLLGHRMNNARLEGMGGVMLSRGIMETTYLLLRPTVRVLLALRIHPNAITAFALLPAMASAVALAKGYFGIGALLATVSAFCDMLDGILARHLCITSDVGELFDAAVDRYVEFMLLAGVAYTFRNTPVMLVLTLAAILGSYLVSYATAKAEALGVPPPKGAMRRPERAVYLIHGCAYVPIAGLFWPSITGSVQWRLSREFPIEAAIVVVAAVTNISSVRRLLRIADSLRARRQAE